METQEVDDEPAKIQQKMTDDFFRGRCAHCFFLFVFVFVLSIELLFKLL